MEYSVLSSSLSHSLLLMAQFFLFWCICHSKENIFKLGNNWQIQFISQFISTTLFFLLLIDFPRNWYQPTIFSLSAFDFCWLVRFRLQAHNL
uniref:Uncharacterized protein n=1 Tax=Octopus bimaculoides TaxID=37653 RepID=A0A0L8H4E9_OCTBM